ncbi:MAG: PAS domain S-box protein, partial [Actinobacteria bacterium]|nr:PAS domain S-box protein [Actinomycetota bacterium]
MKLLKDRTAKSINNTLVKNNNQNLYDEDEKKFWVLFKNAPDACYICDLNGNFIDGNKAAEKLIGYRKEEIIGNNFLKLKILPANQISKATKILTINKLGKPTGPNELIIVNKKGEKVWIELSSHPIKINKKQVMLGIARDINKRKNFEYELLSSKEDLETKVKVSTGEISTLNSILLNDKKELKKSEDKYKVLFNNAPNGIITINTLGRITDCNRRVYEFTGFSQKDLIGKHFTRIKAIRPKDIPRYLKIFNSYLKGIDLPNFQVALNDKQGKTFYGEFLARKTNKNKKLTGFQITIIDITKKVIAEKALGESEERFKLLSEATLEGVLIHDKGRILDANDRLAEIFGVTREEGTGKNIFHYLDKKSHTKVLKNIMMQSSKPFEAIGVRKDKTKFPIDICARTIHWKGKKARVASIRDISSYKENQRIIKEKEEKFRLLSEATSEGIIIHDRGKIIDGNDKIIKMFGINPLETVEKSVLRFIAPSSRPLVMQKMITNYSKPYEAIAQRIDGTRFPIEVCAKVISLEGKKVHVATVRDITTYKEAENTIRESENRFRELSEMLPEMVFEVDLKGNIIYLNRIGYNLFGYGKKDVDRGLNIFDMIEKKE